MGGKPLPLKTQLGPKQNFFKFEKLSALPQNVVVFARDGYNKGLDEALQVAFLVRNALPFHFITPDKAIAIKLRNQGFQCTVTVSSEEVHERLLNALALFLPSHYEGLSLPLLEALAVGVPVVTYAEGFPYFYSKVNDHVKFVRNRDPITASQILIELSQKYINDLNRTPLINRVIFSFEAYCDEVAMVLLSSIKV
jgi:glycosyltransferase involved in cell wall biosynthesis